MPILTISPTEIIQLIDQLDFQNKVFIFDHLKTEILEKRWDSLLAGIDQKIEEFPISEDAIEAEVERAREEFARRGH